MSRMDMAIGMQLTQYLRDNRLTLAQFASAIGVANAGVVAKYVDGSRTPRPAIMREIARVTNGLVQPNDFFAVSTDASAA